MNTGRLNAVRSLTCAVSLLIGACGSSGETSKRAGETGNGAGGTEISTSGGGGASARAGAGPGGDSAGGAGVGGANLAGANVGGAGLGGEGIGGANPGGAGLGGEGIGGANPGGTAGSGGAAAGSAGAGVVLVPGNWGDQGDGTFRNPVLWADYNNLDVTAAGSDFYMIAASHHFMGMPVLRSRDMVNWTLISRIYRRLDVDARYDRPGQAYQHGTWAPAIRFHENRFWVYVTTPAEGLLMTSTADAAGPWDPWQLVSAVARWEDPCPFWDDVPNAGGDGPSGRQAYLIRSQLGAGPLIVQRMSWDGTRLLGTATTVATGPTLEGPKLHKRNGYYYIFAPEGGIDNGYQVVLRSRTILGPYERRTILERGTTAINGPHQGSWIDLPSGESWFYHFQQNQGWGRISHLQPAEWGADEWPRIGVDLDGNGVGEPVLRPRKPNTGTQQPIAVPQSSEEFDAPSLGLQWLWNHNPDPTKWSLSARAGWLRLTARPLLAQSGTNGADGAAVPFVEDSIVFAYDTLVQLAMGRECSAVALLDTAGMIDGQRAGLTLFGQRYGWIGAVRESGRVDIRANSSGVYSSGPMLDADRIFLRASVSASSQISFAYSLDGVSFTSLGGSQTVGRTWFEGIKFGLFSYNLSTGPAGGTADFDFFHYTHDGPHAAP